MLLNCPGNENAQSKEPVNQDYSRVSNRQKETIIRFKNIAFSLPYSLYLNRHLIDSLQHWQNCILRTRRSFQTFTQCYMLGSKLLKGKERFFLHEIWGMPYHCHCKVWGTDLESHKKSTPLHKLKHTVWGLRQRKSYLLSPHTLQVYPWGMLSFYLDILRNSSIDWHIWAWSRWFWND